jgi:hypothetical protein
MEREFIAQTIYAWGRGKDKATALRNMRKHASPDDLKRQGYTVWDCPKGTGVCDVTGRLEWPAELSPAVMVVDKRTEYAKKGRAA